MVFEPRDSAWRTGWRPHDCQEAGRWVSPISSLCGTLLSDKRSRTTPDLSHVFLIAWRGAQNNKDVFACVSVLVGHLWSSTFCAHLHLKKSVLVQVTSSWSFLVCSSCVSERAFLCMAKVWTAYAWLERGAVSQWVGASVWVRAFYCYKTLTLLQGTLTPRPRLV